MLELIFWQALALIAATGLAVSVAVIALALFAPVTVSRLRAAVGGDRG